MKTYLVDIKENDIYHLNKNLLEILLKDHSSQKNIIWATDNYSHRGSKYQYMDCIHTEAITGYKGNVIKPRTKKSKKEQTERVKTKAEVFTPSWICNKQNNLIDNAWFSTPKSVFNQETPEGWIPTATPISFPASLGKTWKDYILDIRLEVSCGEAPYLSSRYDAATGESIDINHRIGFLDRKLRIVNENTANETDWIYWAIAAVKSVYGYDWQGDNVLLARENILFTFIDYYQARFEKDPEIELICQIAEIISWNIWQMDGLKYTIPNSCHKETSTQLSLFDAKSIDQDCPGCRKNDITKHNGIYCRIMDWEKNKSIRFIDLLKGAK